jgi:hypothetical protein
MPPNYRQHDGVPLARSEKRAGWAVAVVVVLVGAGLGIWQLAGGGGTAPKGPCVSINIASSTGGALVRHCGVDAHRWCSAEAKASGAVATQAQAACRQEGLLAATGPGQRAVKAAR